MQPRTAALPKLHIPNKKRDRLFSTGRDREGNLLYHVEKIVSHQSAPDGSMELFHVKWAYFPDCRNTDETEDFIRRNPGGPAALNSYMAANGL